MKWQAFILKRSNLHLIGVHINFFKHPNIDSVAALKMKRVYYNIIITIYFSNN